MADNTYKKEELKHIKAHLHRWLLQHDGMTNFVYTDDYSIPDLLYHFLHDLKTVTESQTEVIKLVTDFLDTITDARLKAIVLEVFETWKTDGTWKQLFYEMLQPFRGWILPKKIVVFGDSYTTGDRSDGTHTTPWVNYFCAMLDIQPSDCLTIATNGIGFAKTVSGKNWYQNFIDNQAQIVAMKPDAIFVVGGYNDNDMTTQQILTGKYDFIRAVNNTPELKETPVFIGMIGCDSRVPMENKLYNHVASNYSILDYRNNVYNCHYLVGAEQILLASNNMYIDNFHPSNDGQRNLALGIYQAMHGAYTHLNNYVNIAQDTSSFPNFVLQERFNNGIVSILFQMISNFTSLTVRGSNRFKLSNSTLFAKLGYNTSIHFSATVRLTNGNFRQVPAHLEVGTDGNIYLIFDLVVASGWESIDITSITTSKIIWTFTPAQY